MFHHLGKLTLCHVLQFVMPIFILLHSVPAPANWPVVIEFLKWELWDWLILNSFSCLEIIKLLIIPLTRFTKNDQCITLLLQVKHGKIISVTKVINSAGWSNRTSRHMWNHLLNRDLPLINKWFAGRWFLSKQCIVHSINYVTKSIFKRYYRQWS